MMSESLKPCPFCGEQPNGRIGSALTTYACVNDHDHVVEVTRSTNAEAIAAWNRRDDKLALIGAATKAAAERDGVERRAMARAVFDVGLFGAGAQAAAAALVGIAKGESDGQAG